MSEASSAGFLARRVERYLSWPWVVWRNREDYMGHAVWPLPVGPEPWNWAGKYGVCDGLSLASVRLASSYLGSRLVGNPFR